MRYLQVNDNLKFPTTPRIQFSLKIDMGMLQATKANDYCTMFKNKFSLIYIKRISVVIYMTANAQKQH